MKTINKIFIALSMSFFLMAISLPAFAQDADVVAGQTVWNELQSGQLKCVDLTQADYEHLGDFYMQQMMGSGHETMDQSILKRYGQAALNQMHLGMGERFSGCNPGAAYGYGMMGYGMPMMGGWYDHYGDYASSSGASSTPFNNNFNSNMMGYGYHPDSWGYMMGGGNWFLTATFWTLIIIGLISLVYWLTSGRRTGWSTKESVLKILRERYAKGEIDRKEFEEKRKDLE